MSRGKKAFTILSLTALILFVFYFFAARHPIPSQTILINSNQNTLIRFFSDDDKTAKWKASITSNKIQFHHYYLTNLVTTKMQIDDQQTYGEMQIVPSAANTCYLRWRLDSTSGGWKNFFTKHATEKKMKTLLTSLKQFTEQTDNIYGFHIEKTKVKDSLLAVTKSILNNYPDMSYVYEQISHLKTYIRQQQAAEKNYPMLYVSKTGNASFEALIAIPVNKEIKPGEGIVMQRMVAGDILWTQCKGGPAAIKKSLEELANYMQDYQQSSPAIPFELLVTDRIKEPDTLKWITRVFYPIY